MSNGNGICVNCKRPVTTHYNTNVCGVCLEGGKVYFVHDYFGCDTGCCGHKIVIEDAKGHVKYEKFKFEHHRESMMELAQKAVHDYGVTIDEARCEIRENC